VPYNAFNGEPCCGNHYLMNDLLREQWEFKRICSNRCGVRLQLVISTELTKIASASFCGRKSGGLIWCGFPLKALNVL
jgi:beta-glucosidase